MESNGEGQPSTFARPVITGSSPTSFQNMPTNGLRLPPHLERVFARGGGSATIQVETQQPSSVHLPVLNQNDISNTIHNATTDVGYVPDLALPAAAPQAEDMIHEENGYSSIDPSFGHNALVQTTQAQRAIANPNMYNDRMPQPEAAAPMLSLPSFQTVARSAYDHQYPNAHDPTNRYSYQTTAPRNEIPYYINPARATQPNAMVAQYAEKIPRWKQPSPPEARPTTLSGIFMENSLATNSPGRDMPLPHNDTLPPNPLADRQPTGNRPAQPNAVNIQFPESLLIRTHVGQVANDGDDMQALGNGGSLREYQSESIDVDNEANNLCGGVNWEMQNKTIDLSMETNEPKNLKRKVRKKEIVSKQEPPPYRIPHKSDDGAPKLANSTTTSDQLARNDGTNKTGFEDPLCQPRRPHTGPPIRPFSSPAPTNSPVRRSPRHANSKIRKADIGAPKLGSSNQLDSNDGTNKPGFKDPLCQPRRPQTGPPLRPFSSPAPANSATTTSDQLARNDGTNKPGFKDPLCQPRRPQTGPPIWPFSSPAPTNSPVRRSPRHANSKSRKPDIELTNSSKQAQPSDANVDVPLGGLGKSTRELDTEISGIRSRSRFNKKRRRPKSGTQVDGAAKISDGTCRTEKRRNTSTLAKRRTMHDARKKKSKKQAPVKPPTNASTKEEAASEDSDGFSAMIRSKKVPTIGNRRIPAQSHGDSPLSNTVGDASESDDESFAAVGNELSSSSEDDDGTSVKTPPRQLRTPRPKVSEAITINDSPEKIRTQRIPRSPGTPRTSRTPRMPKTAGASRGVASKSKCKDIAHDSDGEHFSDSSKGYADRTEKQSAQRKPRGNKTAKVSKTASSPVNLVSPTPSGLERKSIRRSPRNRKGIVSSKQKADDLVADSSDDDFADSWASAQTRGKNKRRTPANDVTTHSCPEEQRFSLQRGPESEGRLNGTAKGDIGIESMDEDPESHLISPSDEDSDIAAEFPSQEQGSQPIDLKVKIVPKRKKAGPKVFQEREFLKLSTDELSIIRVAFIKRYPSPPSNMQAQGRYEAAHGTSMTSGMVQRTWETQLKPWSKRWWDFYLDFNNKVREKKAAKPRNKEPTLKESEVKSWVEEYYREHGDAKPNVTATTTAAITDMEPQ